MKKKLVQLSVFVLFCLPAFSQLQRGNILVGGNIANVGLDLGEGKNFSFLLNPKAAWFFRDNFAAGPYVSLGLSTAKGQGTDVSYGVGAFGRYYFNREQLDLTRHARLFIEGNAGVEGFNPDAGDNTNGLGLGVGPGIAYFITRNIGLEALVKYNGIVGFGSTPTSNLINLSFGFQIYIPSQKIRDRAESGRSN